jgi:hypothetical protein
MSGPFAHRLMYWVGMDIHSDDPEQLQAFHHYYGHVHRPEVLAANPGFMLAHRYVLERPDPRGVAAPKFLAVYELADEQAAQTYLERNDGPPEGRPKYTPGPPVWREHMELRWRMIWRQFLELGPVLEAPESVFIVGMDPPASASPEELAEFNDFYSGQHVGEVMAASGYQRGARYELVRGLLHPDPGCPRYLAIYEADQPTADRLAAAPASSAGGPAPALSEGPAVWQGRSTQWRLTYRRLPL